MALAVIWFLDTEKKVIDFIKQLKISHAVNMKLLSVSKVKRLSFIIEF